jgi:hypothetical protein
MPKVKISEYSATANSNTDVASINIDEGCAPSGINNAIRAVMGHLKDFQQGTYGDPFNGPVNGTVGATTPSTGAFTTLSATGNVTLGDAITDTLNVGNGGLIKDASGNLGLGVTPSAWTRKAIQIGDSTGGYFASNIRTSLTCNYYWSGANYYVANGYSGSYEISSVDGLHRWNIATNNSSGAGAGLTFTQAMTLDASGNLLVGGTSNAAGARLLSENASGNQLGLRYTSIATWYNSVDSSGNYIWTKDGSDKARIDSSGNLLVGTTAAQLDGSSKMVVLNSSATVAEFTASSGTATQAVLRSWNTATSGDNLFQTFHTDAGASQRGSITYNRAGGLVMYNQTSDYRAKDISGPITNSGALIDSVPVYMGKMKGAEIERPMFIAHETPAYAHVGEKDAVDADGNPVYQQMDASALIPVMWAEIQSLRKRLAAAGI